MKFKDFEKVSNKEKVEMINLKYNQNFPLDLLEGDCQSLKGEFTIFVGMLILEQERKFDDKKRKTKGGKK